MNKVDYKSLSSKIR